MPPAIAQSSGGRSSSNRSGLSSPLSVTMATIETIVALTAITIEVETSLDRSARFTNRVMKE